MGAKAAEYSVVASSATEGNPRERTAGTSSCIGTLHRRTVGSPPRPGNFPVHIRSKRLVGFAPSARAALGWLDRPEEARLHSPGGKLLHAQHPSLPPCRGSASEGDEPERLLSQAAAARSGVHSLTRVRTAWTIAARPMP